MHRVELKVERRYYSLADIVRFLMHRVELKASHLQGLEEEDLRS